MRLGLRADASPLKIAHRFLGLSDMSNRIARGFSLLSLLCWAAAAKAHGYTPEMFYALAGIYLLPMILSVLIAPKGRRWGMAGLNLLSVAIGWLIMFFAFSRNSEANLVIAAIGYLLPWVLVMTAAVWRFRRRRA